MTQWDDNARMKNVNDQGAGSDHLYTTCTNRMETTGTDARLTDDTSLANEKHDSADFNNEVCDQLDLDPPEVHALPARRVAHMRKSPHAATTIGTSVSKRRKSFVRLQKQSHCEGVSD